MPFELQVLDCQGHQLLEKLTAIDRIDTMHEQRENEGNDFFSSGRFEARRITRRLLGHSQRRGLRLPSIGADSLMMISGLGLLLLPLLAVRLSFLLTCEPTMRAPLAIS